MGYAVGVQESMYMGASGHEIGDWERHGGHLTAYGVASHAYYM